MASEALARIGPEAVHVLCEALRERDDKLRRLAVSALGQMGTDAKAAVPVLTEALKDMNRNILREGGGNAG